MKQRIHSSHVTLVTGIWSSPQLFLCIVLPCCTAGQTRPMPNVALSSPHEVAIESFPGCVGQLCPTHWRRLVMNHAHWGLSLRFPTLSSLPALSPCLPRLWQQQQHIRNTGHFPLPKNHDLGPFKEKQGTTCPNVVPCPLRTRPHDQTSIALR